MSRTGVVLSLLLFAACSQKSTAPVGWVWPGANPHNTLLFPQSGTRPGAGLKYGKAWDAEYFALPEYELPDVAAAREWGLVVLDLDDDGRLEIIARSAEYPIPLVYDHHGIPESTSVSSRLASARVVLNTGGDSLKWVSVPEFEQNEALGKAPARIIMLNGRPVLIRTERPMAEGGRYARHAVRLSDLDGDRDWTWPLAPMPVLWAVADVNGDGRDELLVGTYGEEHGLYENGTTDHDSCYCLCFDEDGGLLWRAGFGAHPFSGARVCVADVSGDNKLEVVVACNAWQNDFGRLCVLDGTSGRVLAETPGPDGEPASFTAVGCADINSDGLLEIVATTSGRTSDVLLYRFELDRLRLLERHRVGSAGPDTMFLSKVRALADLDGDGKTEIVVTTSRQFQLCPDPVFYPSKFDSSRLVILGSRLEERQSISLPERCISLALADIIPGGNIEILTLSDRLTLYSTDVAPAD